MLLCMAGISAAQTQNVITFSDLYHDSNLILRVKVNKAESRWLDDERGKHIYTYTTFSIEETLKGSPSSDQFAMEIEGGKVGNIKEYVSTSFSVKENQEMILFLSSQDIYSSHAVKKKLNIIEEKIFLENKWIPSKIFSEMLKDISSNRIKLPETFGEIERLIDEGIIIEKKVINRKENLLRTNPVLSSADYNLKPYTPSGWSASVVVSTVLGTHTDASSLSESNNLYIDWAVTNNGTANLTGSFNINLYVDDVLIDYWTRSSGLQAGYYIYIEDYSIGTISGGSHTIKITIDPANTIFESNELDNTYSKTISVQNVSGLPSISQISPTSASAGTGSKIVITGSNFGSVKGSSKVEFFYQSGEPKIESNNYVSWSNTRIECEVPVGIINDYDASAGTGPVTITTASGTSSNYYFTVTFSYGGIRWNGNPAIVKYRINENLSSLTGEGAEINSAASTWTNAGANFSFVNDGTTTRTTPSADGINQVMWGTISDASVLAQAYYWSDDATGKFTEADIRFNNSISWSKNGSNYDIQSIALHELGHWLNLRDLYGGGDADKVMYGFSSSGTTNRTLSTSDSDGIKWIYGTLSTTTYTVSTSSSPATGGSTTGSNTYTSGASVTVSAVPNTGYTFTNWTEGGIIVSTSSTYTFTISANKTLVANFSLNSYSLTITSVNGTVTKNPDQASYNYGTTVTLTATPAAGYAFTGWGGDASGSANPLTVTMNGNKSITANYTINTYTLTITSVNGTVTKNPDQASYNYGTSITLTATPATGYTFINWTENGTIISTSTSYQFTITGNRTLAANFNTTRGDVDSDGIIQALDASLILQAAVGILTLTSSQHYAADVDRDDAVAAIDAYYILYHVVSNGWPEGFNYIPKTMASGTVEFGKMSGNNKTQIISLPINILNPGEVNSIDAEINLGTNIYFESLSSSLPAGWLLSSSFENGKLRIAMTGLEPISEGNIATVNLKLKNRDDIVSVNGYLVLNNNINHSLTAVQVREIPASYSLSQNYPNPFNPSTKIKYDLPENGFTSLIVFDLLGREVRKLVDKEMSAGHHEVEFNAGDLSSGIYFYRLQVKSYTSIKKLLIIR